MVDPEALVLPDDWRSFRAKLVAKEKWRKVIQ